MNAKFKIGDLVSTRTTEDVVVLVEFIGCGFRYKTQVVKVKSMYDKKHLHIGTITERFDWQLTKIDKITL